MAINNEQRSSRPQGGDTKSSPGSPKQAIRSATEHADQAIDEAKHALGDAADSARDALSDVTGEAKKIARDAADTARDFVEENKGRAASQLEGINSAIAKAADELDAKGQGQLATYARNLAGGLDGFTRDINEKSVDQWMGSVSQFARSQPAAFLGAAALLGFVSSRFAMSTAKPTQSAGTSGGEASWTNGQPQNNPPPQPSAGAGGASAAYPGNGVGTSRPLSGGN